MKVTMWLHVVTRCMYIWLLFNQSQKWRRLQFRAIRMLFRECSRITLSVFQRNVFNNFWFVWLFYDFVLVLYVLITRWSHISFKLIQQKGFSLQSLKLQCTSYGRMTSSWFEHINQLLSKTQMFLMMLIKQPY